MKRLLKKIDLKKVVKPFLPKYEVVCTTYHVIPGKPVSGNHSKHMFDRGAHDEARNFYTKVINSDVTRSIGPVEVHLKRRGKVIEQSHFGPVHDLKKLNVVYNG